MYKVSDEVLLRKLHSTPENDVLYRDISGSGVWATLKRFYYDLFLLSYFNSETCNNLSTVHSKTKERARQYLKYPGTIHPFSKFRCCWEYFILSVCILKLVLFRFYTSILVVENNLTDFPWGLGFTCDIVIILDLFVSAKTGYVDEQTRLVVLDPGLILTKFISNRLFWHTLAAIPVNVILFLRYGLAEGLCNKCTSGIFVATLRLFSSLGIVRSIDATMFLGRENISKSFTTFRRYLRIVLMAFLVNSWYNLVYYSLYVLEININNEVKHTMPANSIFVWLNMSSDARPDVVSMTLFVFTRSFFLDYYDFPKTGDILDELNELMRFVSNQFFLIWAFMLTYEITSRALFIDEELEIQEGRVRNMMRSQQVPDVIAKKVQRYYSYPEAATLIIEKVNGLFGTLPVSIKNEIALHFNGRYLKRVPCFVELPTNIMNDIIMLLKEEIYMSGDVISNKYNRDEGMLLLDKGVLARYSEDGEELEHLIDGDYFDVVSLFTNVELNTNTVVAVSDTKILFLNKHLFRKVMRNHPDQFSSIRQLIRRFAR